MYSCLFFSVLMLAHGQAPAPEVAAADLDAVVTLLEFVLEADEPTAVECLDKLCQRAQTGELAGRQLDVLRERLAPALQPILRGDSAGPLFQRAAVLAASWGDRAAQNRLRAAAWDPRAPEPWRARAVAALGSLQDAEFLAQCQSVLKGAGRLTEFPEVALDALSRYDRAEIADWILEAYPRMPSSLQVKAIAMLAQRPAWSKRLLRVVERGELPTSVLNVNQMRGMTASGDEELAALARQLLGTVRTERNPERELVLREMRALLSRRRGDALRGQGVFHRLCGQCHRIHGAGHDVGPDITRNGRSSFDQLLSNVFDPSLVIGPAYQAVTAVTADGRNLTGLLAEDGEQRVVLKVPGGRLETIPRDELEELIPSRLSLMPEGVERQLTEQEIADLFAFITLDLPPGDPEARPIAGTPAAAAVVP